MVCAQHKPEQKAPAGLMGNRPIPTQPWQTISLDFVGPLPALSRGHKYVLVITDSFTKFVHFVPLRAGTASKLCQYVENDIFLTYSVHEFLICDNGTQMRSKEFTKLAKTYDVKLAYPPLYYPRADPTERTNKELKRLLATYVGQNHRSWDRNLTALACALRTSRSEVTGYIIILFHEFWPRTHFVRETIQTS